MQKVTTPEEVAIARRREANRQQTAWARSLMDTDLRQSCAEYPLPSPRLPTGRPVMGATNDRFGFYERETYASVPEGSRS